MGGILADVGSPYTCTAGILTASIKDMGLGKTLSVLALVCSSLDFDSVTIGHSKNTRHQGTLIVAPKSSESELRDMISMGH
jgi:SNF2 family DNA or RNA helicase